MDSHEGFLSLCVLLQIELNELQNPLQNAFPNPTL